MIAWIICLPGQKQWPLQRGGRYGEVAVMERWQLWSRLRAVSLFFLSLSSETRETAK